MEKVSVQIGSSTLTFETGKLAHQADGAVTVSYGDSVVLAAVVMGNPRNYGDDMVPLTVEYREKTAAAGKIPGGFFKREGRPTTKEILTMRMIDRPTRPLFPKGFINEIQITVMVLSAENDFDPNILAMNGASAALAISGIPFAGPVGSVRIARVNDQLVINPTVTQLVDNTMDLIVSGTDEAVLMVEGEAKEVSEDIVMEALTQAHAQIKAIVAVQKELQKKINKPIKTVELIQQDKEIYAKIKKAVAKDYQKTLQIKTKEARREALNAIKNKTTEEYTKELTPGPDGKPAPEALAELAKKIKQSFSHLEKEIMRELVLADTRIDGRGTKDIRPISCEVGLLPRTHGSGLFTRGETQALVIATLGTSMDEQIIDGLGEEYKKKFMLHYSFPPFSTGETKPMRGPGRREIGHGNLAERALQPILPDHDNFPYTIRLVADVLSSNGSSSMASVCGGTLSLMDAGAPIKAPVAGIAMGLVKEGKQIKILSDILGDEDHCGDMDFKIAGSEKGITAVQMDIKIAGITIEIMKQALTQAREGRLHILKEMLKAIDQPRASISVHAPKLVKLKINPEKIGLIIGPGGRIIKELQKTTETTIEVEQDGTVTIFGDNQEGVAKAEARIKSMTEDLIMGKIYQAKVMEIRDFGAIVELLEGGQDGMVHISELADGFVGQVEDVIKLNEEIPLKVINFDDKNRARFSLKQAKADLGLPTEAPPPSEPRPQRRDGPPRGRGGPRRDRY